MENILLLHGAIGCKEQFHVLAQSLQERHHVFTMNFGGHGGAPSAHDSFSMELFVAEVEEFLASNNLTAVNIFGYSMGGYVGMMLARKSPNRIKNLITLATKFRWNEEIAAKECKMLDPKKIQEKVPSFAQQLSDRHTPGDWKKVLLATQDLLTRLGKHNPLCEPDYKEISTPVLLLLGDRDKMVTLEETTEVFSFLPNASLGILPSTSHPIEQVNAETLTFLINNFITGRAQSS